LIIILALGGCDGQRPPAGRLGLKLPPATLGTSISLHQHLKVQYGGRTYEMETALEIDSQRLELVGLVLGQRVLALRYDGQNLQSWRHPVLAPEVRDEDVLEDLQLTLWPIDALRQVLPSGWRIEETGLRRTLIAGETPVAVIDYSSQPPWSGKVEFSNLGYHYRLTIESVSTGP
jgi:hypothetical protein